MRDSAHVAPHAGDGVRTADEAHAQRRAKRRAQVQNHGRQAVALRYNECRFHTVIADFAAAALQQNASKNILTRWRVERFIRRCSARHLI